MQDDTGHDLVGHDHVLIQHRMPSPSRRTIGATLVILGIVALFTALLWSHGAGGLLGGAVETPTASGAPTLNVQWQDYRDLSNLFALRIPTTWQALRETGQVTYGGRTGSDSVTKVTVAFRDPAQGMASGAVIVIATPIGSYARAQYCQGNAPGMIQPFTGLAMTTATDRDPVFLFSSASAFFQVDYVIPGVVEPPHSSPASRTPPPTPMPLPATWVAVDRQLLAAMLASFQPVGPLTISCS